MKRGKNPRGTRRPQNGRGGGEGVPGGRRGNQNPNPCKDSGPGKGKGGGRGKGRGRK